MSLSGDRLVLATGRSYVNHRSMLVVFDISDPGEPLLIAYTVMPGERQAVMIDGWRIYVGDGRGGLGVYSGRPCWYSQMERPEDPPSSTR